MAVTEFPKQRELTDINFGDFVYKVASGIAKAQNGLDLNSAELIKILAETRVDIPRITKTIEKDGQISEKVTTQKRSLLELGFVPTCYQFSETTVEIVTDFKMERDDKGELELKTNVANIRLERKFNETMNAYSKVKTTLVPVPIPIHLNDNVELVDKTGE